MTEDARLLSLFDENPEFLGLAEGGEDPRGELSLDTKLTPGVSSSEPRGSYSLLYLPTEVRLVAGFWKNQRYGPGGSLVKRIFIESFDRKQHVKKK